MKNILVTGLKLLLLGVLMFIGYALPSGLLLSSISEPAPVPSPSATLIILTVFMAIGILFAYPVIRSRWNGWKLAGAMFVVMYGIMTFLPQIETAYFIRQAPLLPPGMLPMLFLTGAITAVLWSPLAVWMLGRFKIEDKGRNDQTPASLPLGQWAWRLAAIVVIYEALYFLFGYFVAWRAPAVASYYGGADPGSFLAQIRNVLVQTPGLPLLQVFRATVWAGLALLVIGMMNGPRWEKGLVVSLLFSTMSLQLLLPNPYMPDAVRQAHFVETLTSDFIFGWLVTWILTLPVPSGRKTNAGHSA